MGTTMGSSLAVVRMHAPVTRADRRRRRDAKRGERRARGALIRFTLAYAVGVFDARPFREIEQERKRLHEEYSEARHAAIVAGCPMSDMIFPEY